MLLLSLNAHRTFSVPTTITTGSLLLVCMALLSQENKLLRGRTSANISRPSTVSNTVLNVYLKISMVLLSLSIVNKSQIE